MDGIFTYIYHKNQLNVGKYTIYGWYGPWCDSDSSQTKLCVPDIMIPRPSTRCFNLIDSRPNQTLFPLQKQNTYTYIYILHISKYSNHEQINIVNPKTSPKKSTHQFTSYFDSSLWPKNHTIRQPTRTCHFTVLTEPVAAPPAGPKLVDRNAPRRHETPRKPLGFLVEKINRESRLRKQSWVNCRLQSTHRFHEGEIVNYV